MFQFQYFRQEDSSMKKVAVILLLSLTASITSSSNTEACTRCLDRNVGCICQNYHGQFKHIVDCSNTKCVFLQPLKCITTNDSSDSDDSNCLVAGQCPFAGRNIKLPLNSDQSIEDLNVCDQSNREGRLCGRCAQGYWLTINTFGLDCVEHSKCHPYHWAVYFIVHFTALTVFFLIVITFNIKATSDTAASFIFFAQVVTLPFNLLTIQRDWAVQGVFGNKSGPPEQFAWAVDAVYGIWSLNIPSGAVYKLCPQEDLSSMAALSVQYVNAAFPLVLIIIAFILILLYQRDFRPVSILWVPFRPCCIRLRRRIDSRTSIIDAFATFVLLSYTKFTYISLIILAPTPLYDINGTAIRHVPLYDGTMEYWHSNHKLYVILALGVLLGFVIPLPCILVFYSTSCFQKCLHFCNLNSHVLTEFVNAFQNEFKDGSNGTRDHRYFAGIKFILRFTIFGLYAFIISDYFLLYTCIAIALAIYSCLYIAIQPYKRNLFNKVDPIILTGLMLIVLLSIYNNIHITIDEPSLALQIIFYLTLYFPVVYLGSYISLWILKKIYTYCKGRMRLNVDENGRPRSAIGRLGQLFDTNSSPLPSPVEDRGHLINDDSSDDGEYSASYINYCQTPTGTNNTTERSTLPTNSSGLNTGQSGQTGSTGMNPTSRRSTRHSSIVRWPLSLRENRIKEDIIALAETS